MRILVLFAQHHWTGPADPELQKLNELRKKGHQITFCYTRKPQGTLDEIVSEMGFHTIESVNLYRKRPTPIDFQHDIRILAKYCAVWKPHIIHCHLSHDHWTGIVLKAFLKKKPVLIRSIHESRKLKESFGDRLLFGKTDGFIVPSKKFGESFVDSYGLDPGTVHVVGGVVDVERFKPGLDTKAIRSEIGVTEEMPLIGIVSRIKSGRGHRQLIQAFRSVAKAHPHSRLLLIGRGELMEKLKESNRDLSKDGLLHFLGYRKEDLPTILNALLVKVLLAEGTDGTCRAVLEALSCGVPVIAAEVGVLPETVQDGKTGLLVRAGDTEFLEGALHSALENQSRMKQMGNAARSFILENHTVERAAQKVETAYQQTISGQSK